MDESVSTSSSLRSSVSSLKHRSTPNVDDSMDNVNPIQVSGKGKGKQRSVYDPVLLDLIVCHISVYYRTISTLMYHSGTIQYRR